MAEEPKTEPEPKWFTCCSCNLRQEYEVKGKEFPLAKNVALKEDSYVMKDPFSDQHKTILLLGSDCVKCGKSVCQSPECSIYYKSRYCHECAANDKNIFPEQLRSKIKTLL